MNRALALILLAAMGAAFYALEGNVVARWGTFGADAVQVLFGASVLGMVLCLPLALATGIWITPSLPLATPDLALVAASVIHAVVYASYVWMLGRAGPVFTTQVGYLVTGLGIVSAMLILGERYSGWVWVALAVVLAGVALVRPRRCKTLDATPAMGEYGA